MPMKRILVLATALFLLLQGVAFAQPPQPGDPFPDLPLRGTLAPEAANELGVDPDEPILSDVDARYVLVEVFNMYCPHCQREAPTVNELHTLLGSMNDEMPAVALIGIGVGNSQFEVDVFRRKYEVTFPLFIDPDYEAYAAVGKVGTPYFFLVERTPDGLVTRHIQAGGFGDVAEYYRELLAVMKEGN